MKKTIWKYELKNKAMIIKTITAEIHRQKICVQTYAEPNAPDLLIPIAISGIIEFELNENPHPYLNKKGEVKIKKLLKHIETGRLTFT